ncbi:centrosomal protein of 192 kDa [Notamacropus eugenii]|uniref:centrosomal protein of 192 kDa n=1 Tax=Notamacropus eugenii TaxID=9315 RepID=UPI003B678BCA
MFVARSIAADHKDLIHDVSFDFHGRRMATCSSDQSVKVWDKSESGDWHCTASWKTHSGSVWRVTWAHPEFGQVLASCSFDRTAAVWEEIVGESNDKLRGQSHWVKRTTLVDSRTSVTDVKFAPKHMGLMLATCSADGVVRIYEAPDVMNLSQWSLQHEISCKLSCSCISWNPSSSRAHSPMIAVGSDDNSPNVSAKVQIYEYNENTRKYAKAESLMTVTDPVHDISFAPNLGRSFHILAVATKDVRIFTLKPVRKELTSSGGPTKFEIHIVAQFDNHNSQVWRVSWNITGTVLASSGDDGCVRLWKANYMDNWKCTGILKGNGSPVNGTSSQQGISNASLGSNNPNLQNSLNGSSASRYFFPPLDSPRAGSRWSSYAQILPPPPPPPPPPPLIEHSCDADTANLQYPHPRRRYISRPLNPLPENEGVYALGSGTQITIAQLVSYSSFVQLLKWFFYSVGGIAGDRLPRPSPGASQPVAFSMGLTVSRAERAGLVSQNTGGVSKKLCALAHNDPVPCCLHLSPPIAPCSADCRAPDLGPAVGEGRRACPRLCKGEGRGSRSRVGAGLVERGRHSLLALPGASARRCSANVTTPLIPPGGHEESAFVMENFRRIVDESFPSSLTNSLTSNKSGILENISISSNLGLPVAVSTVARNRYCHNDRPDVSRLAENQGISDIFMKELSYQQESIDTLPIESVRAAHSIQGKDSFGRISPLDQVKDISTDVCLPHLRSRENKIDPRRPLFEEERSLLENEKLLSFRSLEDSSDEDIDDEEFYDDHLEAYFQQLASPEKLREDQEEQELPESSPTLRRISNDHPSQVNENHRPKSEDSISVYSLGTQIVMKSELNSRQCEESPFNPVVSENEDCIEEGKGDRNDGPLLPSNIWGIEKNRPREENDTSVYDPSVNNVSYCEDTNINQGNFVLHPLKLGEQSAHQNNITPKISIQKNVDTHSMELLDNEFSPVDAYWSPTTERRICENWNSNEKNNKEGALPHSVVYQNEEGKWVTDLAYYTSFNEVQDLNLCRDNEINEEFRTGSEAMALIAQDEEEFEREHRFMQEEKIDLQNSSDALGDTSWSASVNYNLLRRSHTTSDMAGDDASYLWLSLGEFFGQRSEALGCLGGGINVKRPSFGYFITSPEKREPVALLRESDVPTDNLKQDREQHVVFSEDVKDRSREPVCNGSTTFNTNNLETTSQIDENDKIFKGRAEDALVNKSNDEKYEDKISDCSDTILHISTIASAIDNASVSADPSQLAAMMMALSNKNKQKTFLEASNKERDFSSVNQMLPNHLESNGANSFDMEKYLKKTEVSGYEGSSDKFLKTGLSSIWDLSLSNKQTTQDFLEVDLHTASVNVREPEENPDVIFNKETEVVNQESFAASDLSKNIEKHWDNKQCAENTPDKMIAKQLSPKQMLAFGKSNVRESLMDDTTENERSLKTESSSLKQIAGKTMNPLNSFLANVDRETVDKMFSNNAKIPDVGRGGKPTLISTPKPSSYLPVRNFTTTFNWTSVECKEIHDRETQRQNEDNCDPHSSDKSSEFRLQNIGTNCCLTDLKNTSPERDAQCLEDEQFSFRPSASPLIHSSPSEVSETGPESNFLSSSVHLQRHCDGTLPPSICSSPSMARLTYVSVRDSTFPATADGDISGKSQSDAPSELSTTIVRSSPTLLEDQAVENVKETVPLQNSDKVSGVNSSSLDKNVETDQPATSGGKIEDALSNSKVSEHSSLRSAQPFSCNELGQVIESLSSKSCLFHPPLSTKIDIPVSCQDCVTQSQELTSTNVLLPQSGLSSHIPLPQNTSSDQYVPVSSFNSQGPASEMQDLSGAVPTLLNRNSITTAPFNAQQYLRPVSTGNVALPQYHIGSSTVCGYSGGYSCTAIPGEHIQNSVAVGMCLGCNVGSGLLGPTSLCNAHSNTLSQNLISTTKPFSGPPVGTYGIELWESRIASGFGNVRVPEELKFPHACCVGIASQTNLSIFNPTDRWLQVTIGILSITVDGEKVDLSTCHCLVFKNKTVIGPHTTEEIKVLFMPAHPGIFRCVLRVSSWPVSSDLDAIAQAEALANRIVLTAVAENPVVEVEPVNTNFLDFGDLTYGSWKVLPLKLVNKTHAVIPVRLIINANAIAWRCFTFSKEPVSASLETALQSDIIAQLTAPSVINHVMYASRDGHDPEFLKIWVIFHGPKKQISPSGNLGAAEEFLARIDVEVDSPSPTTVIKSVALRARVGIARIHAPKDLQSMHLLASVGSSTKQFLPLKNAGNIDVHLNIKISDQFSYFSVNPENLFLKPEEEQEIAISFTPKDFRIYEESHLKILVQPSGPQYEVVLKGEVDSSGNKYQTPVPPSHYSDVPPILSNKQFMTWGGIVVGRTHLQKLALRNNSSSTTQRLRLLIRGQDQDCFQLQNTFGLEERLTSTCEIIIRPKEDINIFLLFAPTRISCMLAKLEIKQLGIQSQPGIKFSIPLSGYGGASNLILEDVKKLSDSYMVTVNSPIPGKESRIVFSVRNTGSRAAYVKAVCFKDSQGKVLLDPQVMRILPDKFVLKERAQEMITLIYNPTEKEKNCQTAPSLLSTIYFFGGDEILRQQYRRALLHKPEIVEQILPEHSLLKKICFDEAFQDEQLITEVYDLPERPNDVQFFYGNMRKIILSVIGDFADSSSSLGSLQNCLQHNLASKSESRNSERHINNVSLDVLPVKGPQGPPLPSQATAQPGQNTLISQQIWTVQPEHLILKAPSVCSMTKTGHLHILNNSVRLLKFELSWPAHCLTVTPQHGVIDPESRLLILVSPNSSLATKPSTFPWSGLIYIHCDNGQKVVKVQIREDITKEGPSTCLASKQILTSESPLSHMLKPGTKPPSTKVEIKTKTITFPETEPGETSENYLELENHGDEEVKWNLSSFAPPYVKDVDESGDVFRATYAAFRCSRISGILQGHGKQKVAITFLPRDRGNYAQFWDVECYPSATPHMKHTLRFQLSGLGVSSENGSERIPTNAFVKTDNLVRPRRRIGSEASVPPPRQVDLAQRGVNAPQDIYIFLPVRVGETRTVKVNLRNNSFSTHLLKFLSPREPFYVKHSKYSLRAQHYINMPVQFKPKSAGKFEGLLVVQTDEGKSIGIRLVGEALEKV